MAEKEAKKKDEKTVASFPSLQGLIAKLIATPTVPGSQEERKVTAAPVEGRTERIQQSITPEAFSQLTPHAQQLLKQRVLDAVNRMQESGQQKIPFTFEDLQAENFLKGLTQ